MDQKDLRKIEAALTPLSLEEMNQRSDEVGRAIDAATVGMSPATVVVLVIGAMARLVRAALKDGLPLIALRVFFTPMLEVLGMEPDEEAEREYRSALAKATTRLEDFPEKDEVLH